MQSERYDLFVVIIGGKVILLKDDQQPSHMANRVENISKRVEQNHVIPSYQEWLRKLLSQAGRPLVSFFLCRSLCSFAALSCHDLKTSFYEFNPNFDSMLPAAYVQMPCQLPGNFVRQILWTARRRACFLESISPRKMLDCEQARMQLAWRQFSITKLSAPARVGHRRVVFFNLDETTRR